MGQRIRHVENMQLVCALVVLVVGSCQKCEGAKLGRWSWKQLGPKDLGTDFKSVKDMAKEFENPAKLTPRAEQKLKKKNEMPSVKDMVKAYENPAKLTPRAEQKLNKQDKVEIQKRYKGLLTSDGNLWKIEPFEIAAFVGAFANVTQEGEFQWPRREFLDKVVQQFGKKRNERCLWWLSQPQADKTHDWCKPGMFQPSETENGTQVPYGYEFKEKGQIFGRFQKKDFGNFEKFVLMKVAQAYANMKYKKLNALKGNIKDDEQYWKDHSGSIGLPFE